ncbi:hypothetical protein QJS83_07205 [Bdellovibrio sp. 22V]|uniref:hypothetical protein n=1 Tax=Bdellovibrio TaxID=958 RepID=UPI0025430B35|nr:hypothetical protein [Bdellovibrio sp. 22V]WII73660.1 hypothetical protein QJS83_07205 [Bdellovibrio sp. 22V]
MRILIYLSIFMISQFSYGQQKCGSSESSLKNIEKLCGELNKKNESHCQSNVKAQKQNLPAVSYGLLGASGKMKSLFQQLESLQKDFLADSSGCPGGCSKVSAPVVEIQTKPTGTIPDPQCPAAYSEMKLSGAELAKFAVLQAGPTFKKSFRLNGDAKECQEQATKFAQETLMGDNDLGEFLEEKKCQSPCSYSSVIRLKTKTDVKSGCGVELELAVLCGPPKKEREWVTHASLTKTFRCEVAK